MTYEKDKSQRLTLRLSQEQFDFLKKDADLLGVTPSEYLRMVINATMKASAMMSKTNAGLIQSTTEKLNEGK